MTLSCTVHITLIIVTREIGHELDSMRRRTVVFIAFVGVMIGLGLLVNSTFFLIGMVGLCGGHMLLGHGHGNEHAATSDDERKKGCH